MTKPIKNSVLLLLGLSAFLTTSGIAAEARLPANALPVPLVVQAADYSCGAGALLSVLYYWHAYTGVESALYPKLQTTEKDGTEPEKIGEVAGTFGLQSKVQMNMTVDDLRHSLAAGDTVILDFQSGAGTAWKDEWESGHYAVLVAMDNDFAYLMDPSVEGAYVYVPVPEFVERWHDYEHRHGPAVRNHHLGIIIHGTGPMMSFPGPLVRLGA